MAPLDLFINGIAITVYDVDTASPPVIVMGHGIGAVRAAGLKHFAAAFNSAGYAAVTFDYRSFGDSEGHPRNVLSVSRELHDFEEVIGWARAYKDPAGAARFDPARVVAWGTSFGGMHIAALMARDHSLAAGIAQCPCVDGFAASTMQPLANSSRLTAAAVYDVARQLLRLPPKYVRLYGPAGQTSPTAIMRGAEAVEGYERMTIGEGIPFFNGLAARSLLSVLVNRPARHVHKSTAPLLVVVTGHDTEAPRPAAIKAAQRAPKGELVEVPGGHFDVYRGGVGYDANVAAQLAFLARALQ